MQRVQDPIQQKLEEWQKECEGNISIMGKGKNLLDENGQRIKALMDDTTDKITKAVNKITGTEEQKLAVLEMLLNMAGAYLSGAANNNQVDDPVEHFKKADYDANQIFDDVDDEKNKQKALEVGAKILIDLRKQALAISDPKHVYKPKKDILWEKTASKIVAGFELKEKAKEKASKKIAKKKEEYYRTLRLGVIKQVGDPAEFKKAISEISVYNNKKRINLEKLGNFYQTCHAIFEPIIQVNAKVDSLKSNISTDDVLSKDEKASALLLAIDLLPNSEEGIKQLEDKLSKVFEDLLATNNSLRNPPEDKKRIKIYNSTKQLVDKNIQVVSDILELLHVRKSCPGDYKDFHKAEIRKALDYDYSKSKDPEKEKVKAIKKAINAYQHMADMSEVLKVDKVLAELNKHKVLSNSQKQKNRETTVLSLLKEMGHSQLAHDYLKERVSKMSKWERYKFKRMIVKHASEINPWIMQAIDPTFKVPATQKPLRTDAGSLLVEKIKESLSQYIFDTTSRTSKEKELQIKNIKELLAILEKDYPDMLDHSIQSALTQAGIEHAPKISQLSEVVDQKSRGKLYDDSKEAKERAEAIAQPKGSKKTSEPEGIELQAPKPKSLH